MSMELSPCSWPVDQACYPHLPDEEAKKRFREALDTAVGVLWALTGRRFGVCPVEARPCPPDSVSLRRGLTLESGPGWTPYLDNGVMRNGPTCESFSCDRSGAILLPGPVYQLLEFIVGGETIDTSSLILDGDRVFRAQGGSWPEQNLNIPPARPGGWAIRYLRGTPPPPGAANAVTTLAKEFYNACTGGRCRLPRRTQQVQRQGVTVTMVDPQDIYAEGCTGIPEIDLWVRAHNPNRLPEPTLLWSPDQEVW